MKVIQASNFSALKIGTTSASFHEEGNSPMSIEYWETAVKMSDIVSTSQVRSALVKPSGPDFRFSNSEHSIFNSLAYLIFYLRNLIRVSC